MGAGTNYHHGDLRAALLKAAEGILAERGSGALTLRACARAAGVSHAAPAHHFGNLSGLLTALVVAGVERLAGYQLRASARAGDAAAKKRAAGLGYIRFALEHPALFELIFRDARIDRRDPEYVAAVQSGGSLVRGLLASSGNADPDRAAVEWVRSWSLVHGFAVLASAGALSAPGERRLDAKELLKLAASVLGG